MANGRTRKPCHGCGEAGWREIDRLCETCQRELSNAKATNDAMQRSPDNAEFAKPWRHYSLPYIPHLRHANSETEDAFQTAFIEIIERLSVPIDGEKYSRRDRRIVIDGTKDHDGTIYLNPKIAELLNTIYQSTLKMVDAAYLTGKAEGQSFITQLASGEVSIEEFNRAATAGQ